MIGVGNIKIDGKGKTPEQIKEEILANVSEQLDAMLKEKEEKKEETKPSFIHIEADESAEKDGFGVHVEFDGDFEKVMTILTVAVSQALHNIADDEEDEYNPELLLDFIMALTAEFKGNALSHKEEKEDGEE